MTRSRGLSEIAIFPSADRVMSACQGQRLLNGTSIASGTASGMLPSVESQPCTQSTPGCVESHRPTASIAASR